MKKLIAFKNWLYEKYLDWRLRQVYPNGVSKEEYQRAILNLIRKKDE